MSLLTIMLLTGEVTTFIFIWSFRNKISCLRFTSTRFRGGITEHDRMYLLCTQHNVCTVCLLQRVASFNKLHV